MATRFAILPASQAPDPGRPWVRCLTCHEAVVDHPPATEAHRRRHRARPLRRRPLTPHHRCKASQGGRYTLANLVTLCRHHNNQLEARADIAALGERLGLVIRRNPGLSHPAATLDEAS